MSAPATQRDVRIAYIVEGIACLGTNLLLIGVYFYTHSRLGWTLKQNFLLATGQGLVGGVGSLLAHPISSRLSRRGALIGIYIAMALLPAILLMVDSAAAIATLLLIYTMVVSLSWPMLESFVATGVQHEELSRRIGIYNLVWSGAAVLIIAASGWLIKHIPSAVFIVPLVVHAVSAILIMLVREPADPDVAHEAVHAEPGLLQLRRLALALSRVSLPATYVVIYSMMAMLPSLPAIRTLSPTMATLIGSTWMAARWLTFLILGSTVWWHTRPRILVAAAIAMVLAFLGIILPGSRVWIWAGSSDSALLSWMIASQILLGLCVGAIYAASLYFGMVLSGGSAEHAGYHESLINFGSAIGPIAGVVAEVWYPGNIYVVVSAVTGVVGLSVAATVFTSLLAGKRQA
ncbi:MAG TPA: MFS transporter [Tepidisphaeraceae bacterium]|nr:MFS transporter [Tepidisphaeraceae bacterium]